MNTSTSAWMSVPKSRISSRGCCAQGGWSPGLYERDGVDLHARGNTAKELRWNSGNPWKQGDRDGHHWGELSVPYQQRSIQSKLWFFPVVMHGCESWTIKKAECRRIDAFELWCWRRLLRVPWTARRSNQSILKEINPEYSLEGLMLKLKLQYVGHLMTHWKRPWCWERL